MAEGERRLHIPIHLRWGDLDAFNHVNNTSMLKLLEEARVRAFWEADDAEPQYPTAVVPAGAAAGVLTLIARGATNSEIAGHMSIADTTVKTHVSALMSKLAARDRVALVLLAHKAGIA